MTNYEKFTQKEEEIKAEQRELRELVKKEDEFYMYLSVLSQVKKIEALRVELRRLFELDQDAEYIPSLAEELFETAKTEYHEKKRKYCTQNDGNCETCSLSSYGKDCQNN